MLCYDKIIESLQPEFNAVLNVVKEKGCKFFEDGIDRIHRKYENLFSKEKIEAIIHDITATYFLEGNETTQEVLLAHFYFALHKNNEEDGMTGFNHLAAAALRAIHFENYGKKAEGYKTITEDACRKFVLSNKTYNKEIEKHPFDKEEYIQKFMKQILNSSIFSYRKSSLFASVAYWLPQGELEDYYTDAICNLAWKVIAKKYEVEPTANVEDIVELFFNYIVKLYAND